MIWKILRRILRRHLFLHLLIPLVVGLCFHILTARFMSGRSWDELWAALLTWESFLFVAGIIFAYFVVMYYLIRKETSIRIGADDLAVLDGGLTTARNYFATSTIDMKEWFDPISQVFLASITKQKLRPGWSFHDERVLLFFRRADIDSLYSPYLDGYYAQRLAEIHKHYGIPLAFLERSEIFEILETLPWEQRKAIGCYPRRIAWLGGGILRRIRLSRIRRSLRELDFALVEDTAGTKCVLKVSKQGQNVRIRCIKGNAVEPYARLVELIKERVNVAGSEPVRVDDAHDFVKRFYPFA